MEMFDAPDAGRCDVSVAVMKDSGDAPVEQNTDEELQAGWRSLVESHRWIGKKNKQLVD